MTLAAGAAQIKELLEEGEQTPPTTTTSTTTTIAPRPSPPEAQRLFNKSLLQPFAVLRLGIVGSMGATNQQGVPGLAAAQIKKKKKRKPHSGFPKEFLFNNS